MKTTYIILGNTRVDRIGSDKLMNIILVIFNV